jgi:hypothetical protein
MLTLPDKFGTQPVELEVAQVFLEPFFLFFPFFSKPLFKPFLGKPVFFCWWRFA